MNPIDVLLARLRRARRWPLDAEMRVRVQLAMWAALRENDEAVLRRVMKWKADRDLVIDNLPEKIASAYGDLLFGTEPEWTPSNEADAQLVDDMTAGWDEGLPSAEETCVSEGEVWWRLTRAEGLDHPALTFHSRADVVPLLYGREVQAVAFVSTLPSATGERGVVDRHFELHGPGEIRNVLFRGRSNALGREMALDRSPETAGLPDVWRHGLPILAGRIVNRWGRRPHCGVSIYQGVWTRFLALNEAATIGKENMRLTAKKRVVVPASAVRGAPGNVVPGQDVGDGSFTKVQTRAAFDASEDVLVADPLDAIEGQDNGGSQFRVLEYSFDAQALIAWQDHEVETICQRCDLVPQFIGSGDFGQGNTGTALRVRLLPTVNAAEARGRHWDDELPVVAQKVQLLEAAPIGAGGLGRDAWKNPAAPPAIERDVPFPEDPDDIATRQSTLKTADLLSLETALRERYPDRDGGNRPLAKTG
jgi:hypothetical protein